MGSGFSDLTVEDCDRVSEPVSRVTYKDSDVVGDGYG